MTLFKLLLKCLLMKVDSVDVRWTLGTLKSSIHWMHNHKAIKFIHKQNSIESIEFQSCYIADPVPTFVSSHPIHLTAFVGSKYDDDL